LLSSNKAAKWVIGGAAFFLILILNVPLLLNLFQFDRIDVFEALLCIIAGLLSIAWLEIYKKVQHGKQQAIPR
jgi:P-type Ca2+ transporter type 2C